MKSVLSTLTDLGPNPVFGGEKQVTNHQSYGTAQLNSLQNFCCKNKVGIVPIVCITDHRAWIYYTLMWRYTTNLNVLSDETRWG
jgi:hypothetical protein